MSEIIFQLLEHQGLDPMDYGPCHDDDTENYTDATDEETADRDEQENNKRKKVNWERGNEKRVQRISNSVVETIALRQERE